MKSSIKTHSIPRSAFTLIELLIVVAIIAILAAIAVPNFLEAQVRAKVSRVKNDLRTVATGLEAYAVDWNWYPPENFPGRAIGDQGDSSVFIQWVTPLTTPVAYLTTVELRDPFTPSDKAIGEGYWKPVGYRGTYNYNFFWGSDVKAKAEQYPFAWAVFNGCAITSFAPNRVCEYLFNFPSYQKAGYQDGINYCWTAIYDSTNGTVSKGDIGRFCGFGLQTAG